LLDLLPNFMDRLPVNTENPNAAKKSASKLPLLPIAPFLNYLDGLPLGASKAVPMQYSGDGFVDIPVIDENIAKYSPDEEGSAW